MEVNVRIRDSVIILKPDGRIIGIVVDELRQLIETHLQNTSDSPKFLFDFADVSRIDSTGLGTLIGLYVSIVRRVGRVGVINVNKALNNLLTIGRITLLEHFDSEAVAVAKLQGA